MFVSSYLHCLLLIIVTSLIENNINISNLDCTLTSPKPPVFFLPCSFVQTTLRSELLYPISALIVIM